MESRQVRPALGERTSRKQKQRYLFKQKHHNKHTGNFQRKIHPSRHPEQRNLDRALLAMVGLRFEPVHAAKGGHYE